MLMIKNELITSLIMSTLVAVLVWFNTPKATTRGQEPASGVGKSVALFIKSFVVAFGVTFTIFYFTSETGTDEVIDNMIKGAPTF
jgi:hypothetical protein